MVLLYELTPFTYGREEDPPPPVPGWGGGIWALLGVSGAQRGPGFISHLLPLPLGRNSLRDL